MIPFLDCFAGIAGDMLVAALIHAGAPLDVVLADVRAVGIPGWEAHCERVHRGAYAATRFVVRPSPAEASSGPAHDHSHAHDGSHDHSHAHSPVGDSFPGQPQRDWAAIRALLTAAELPPRVRSRALSAFARLAEAESRVHGVHIDDVQFHEVGAVDSIVDIVAACSAMEALSITEIVATPLPMGQGAVRTQHGILSIPVPATVEVLRGYPVMPSPFAGELVTPTGAALIAALAKPGAMPAMIVRSVGYGAGTRDPSTHANVLRAVIGEGQAGSLAEVVELSAQVDDLPGEAVPPLLDALFEAGAIDAFVVPVLMKKGRPGLWIHALCAVDAQPAVGQALVRHSGTFGYRWTAHQREVMSRRWEAVTTEYGVVRVKIAEHAGSIVHASPEYEDCRAAALAAGVPVGRVHGAALAIWANREPT